MGTYIEPFDLKEILIGYFLGNTILFFFALVILTSLACARYNMSNRLYVSVLMIGSILFSLFLGEAIYIFVLFITGIVIFTGLKNLMNR